MWILDLQHPSTLERIISPLWRGDLGVCSNNKTHPALRAPLSRGEAMPCWRLFQGRLEQDGVGDFDLWLDS